ncbi:MAG TPA: hypothetical protein PKY81_00235 [bacterium]|nr:hypothetical protein [bacterium]HPN29361.1 hypothetical protein [bacterium]
MKKNIISNDLQCKSIGVQKERSLHCSIKKAYFKSGDLIEHKIGKYITDIFRNGLIIEIQTAGFSSLKKKLADLLPDYKIKIVYPMASHKSIVKISESGEILSSRKSPKKFSLYDAFDELINIRKFLNHPNLSVEFLVFSEEQIRKNDGKGSWRRKGVSIVDRKLVKINKKILLSSLKDYICFIPKTLKFPYSNKTFAKKSGVSIYKSRKINYVLKSIGLIKVESKNGKEFLFGLNSFFNPFKCSKKN